MYSREERMKAIELYAQCKSIASVIRELGYPSRNGLRGWYQEYLKELKTGVKWERAKYRRSTPGWSRYSLEQKQFAVDFFFNNKYGIETAVKRLGYPSPVALSQWCNELAPGSRELRNRVQRVQYLQEQNFREQKNLAEIVLGKKCENTAKIAEGDVAARPIIGITERDLLGEEKILSMATKNIKEIREELKAARKELEQANKDLYRARLECAILEKTAELIKKDPGIDPKNLTNKEKTVLVDALKNEFPLNILINMLGISRSSYYYQRDVISKPDKYSDVRKAIKMSFGESNGNYGYRRIWSDVRPIVGTISEKVIRRIMKEESLTVAIKRLRKYSSYQGESTPSADNLIERDFHADAPNVKWLTDITEFHIPAGKVYLSPIVDCFDGMLPSWTIGTRPDAELVNTMLDNAINTLAEGEHPLIHSDRGCHYRWPGWLSRMEQARLQRSMSKKACSPDNAACEGFFGRLKNEMFYNRSWQGVSIEDFIDILNRYIYWYNEKRIKMSLGGMSPLQYRLSLGLTV